MAGGRDLGGGGWEEGGPAQRGPHLCSSAPPCLSALSSLPSCLFLFTLGLHPLLTSSTDCICHTDLRRGSWRGLDMWFQGSSSGPPTPHSRRLPLRRRRPQGSASSLPCSRFSLQPFAGFLSALRDEGQGQFSQLGDPCLGADLSWCVPLSSPRFSCPSTRGRRRRCQRGRRDDQLLAEPQAHPPPHGHRGPGGLLAARPLSAGASPCDGSSAHREWLSRPRPSRSRAVASA